MRRSRNLKPALSTHVVTAQTIADEFGIYGGGTFPEWHCHQGGADPKFWLESIAACGKPTLRGQPLLERVRELLKIPYPLVRADA